MPLPDERPADGGLTRRTLLVLGGSVVAASALRTPLASAVTTATAASSVPTLDSVTGFPLGSQPATAAQLDTYLLKVASSSPRVIGGLLDPGKSLQGRPLRFVVVSHPDNLARLASIEARTRALRLKPPSAAEAAKAARELPAIVNVIADVHGNEPSGADALARLLYELAARDDDANLERLRNLVICARTTATRSPGTPPSGRTRSSRACTRPAWRRRSSSPERVPTHKGV